MEILNDPHREDRLHNYSCSLHRRLWNVASRQQRCVWLSLDRPGRRRSGMADGTIPGACAILYWYRCWHLRRHATPTFPTCTAIYGCILFFGMGKKSVGGQRIFNIETPGFLAEANAQKETNLHNLVIGETSVNKLVFGKLLGPGLATFLTIIPIAYQRSASFNRLLNHFAVPIPRPHHTLAILAMVLLIETSTASNRGEITEFAITSLVFTSLVFFLLLNPLNKQTFRRRPAQKIVVKAVIQHAHRNAA